MGSRLDGFDIQLEFDAKGKVRTISYADGNGCGHSALFSNPATKLTEVVDYHLAHYKQSHRMEPRKKCSFELPHTSEAGDLIYYCTLEPHPGDNHELELKR